MLLLFLGPSACRKWPDVASRRTLMPEPQLATLLGKLNGKIRAGLPQDILNSLQVGGTWCLQVLVV